jgi:hypothetical protein
MRNFAIKWKLADALIPGRLLDFKFLIETAAKSLGLQTHRIGNVRFLKPAQFMQ